MPRRKRLDVKPIEVIAQSHGGNVTDDVAKKHFNRIFQLETKLAGVRGELGAAWKEAESEGIEKKPFKAAMKLLNGDPASASAYLRKLDQYTVQLGLLDRIDAWKQSETNEANAASVERAEEDLGQQPKPAGGEPKNGGTLEAAYAQGFEAANDGAERAVNPYKLDPHRYDEADAWDRGWHFGAIKNVDATNSEIATEMGLSA